MYSGPSDGRGARTSRIVCIVLVAAFLGSAAALGKDPKQDDPNESAIQLVCQARQAEIDGNVALCYRLLWEAVRIAPDSEFPRWQLGQLKVDGEWLTVEEAQRRAAANSKQRQYRELRAQYGETPEGQLALARWCRKNDLVEEARFHWASVLAVDPYNVEALRALDVRWSGDQLLTREQIASQKESLRERNKSVVAWKPKIAKWQRAVGGEDAVAREAALTEIGSITAVEVIPAFEEVTLGHNSNDEDQAEVLKELSLALVGALDKMPDHAATKSLVRHAVLSPSADVRTAAIDKLKSRPLHDYVPLFMSGLAMPLESSFSVFTTGDGSVHYRHSLYREGQDSDWSFDKRLSAVQNDLRGRHYTYDVRTQTVEVGPPTSSKPSEMLKKARIESNYVNHYSNEAAVTELQVRQLNRVTEAFNALLIQALTGTTGRNFANPKEWWNWWQDHNEYYASGDHPVDHQYYADTDNYYSGASTYNVRYPPPPPGTMSCFAKGTLVWTKTGQREIETLELGDLVLSQNVDTGELCYKPVIGRTVRPPSQILNVYVRGEEIRTTLGHPFWVSGTGWQMAKELKADAILHGVTGSTRVLGINPAEQAEAYNLVVADFNTYFVGDGGVLVHDNTPRTPSRVSMPGVAAK